MKTSQRLPRLLAFALLATVLLTVGCSEDDPVSPGIQPEIVNSVDNFQFQVTAMKNYSGSLQYAWSNTGTMAVVDQSCAISGGTATLVLLDDAGNQVYSRSMAEDGSLTSNAGTSGNWTIRVSLSQATGTLNFRADKATP
jgi:hypothetical protein